MTRHGSTRAKKYRKLLAAVLALGVAACAAGGAPAQSAPAAPSSDAAPVTDPAAQPVTVPAAEPGTPPPPEPVAESPSAPVPQPVDPLLGTGQIVWETKDSGVAVPDGWRACAVPEDCELVTATCCDECNGGKAVSVAKAHAANARAKLNRTGCGACTKRGCSTRAFCEAARCVMQWQAVR